MKRLCLAIAALALGTACSTLSTIHGARTLEPGQVEVGFATSLQRGGNPITIGTIPLPQPELALRFGLRDNMDLGWRLYPVGAQVDLRYRFYHQDNLHVAFDPALGALWVPLYGGTLGGQGSVTVRAPVIAEYEIGPYSSIMGGPTLILRRQRNAIEAPGIEGARLTRLDAFAGGGVRYEVHPKQIVLGASFDLYAQPARHAGPAFSVGLDFGIVPKARARSRQ